MAISSEILGKLGGTEVQQIEVPSFSFNGLGRKHVMFSDTVPEGERRLVVFEGKSSASGSVNSSSPEARIGDYQSHVLRNFGISGVVTGDYDVAIASNSGASYTYEGTIYIMTI